MARGGDVADIKSIGHSTTTPRDLVCEDDVRMTVYILSEAVAARLREMGFLCRTVQIYVRDRTLESFERQQRLSEPTCLASALTRVSMDLFRANYGLAAARRHPQRRCAGCRSGHSR